MPPTDDGDPDGAPTANGAAADYRRVPDGFSVLTGSERRTAWAVVRCLSTSAWITWGVLLVAYTVAISYVDLPRSLDAVVVVALAAHLAGCVSLEVKTRDLAG